MFENPRRGRQARSFTTNVPKILDLKSSSEQIFSESIRWVPLKTVVNSLADGIVQLAILCIYMRRIIDCDWATVNISVLIQKRNISFQNDIFLKTMRLRVLSCLKCDYCNRMGHFVYTLLPYKVWATPNVLKTWQVNTVKPLWSGPPIKGSPSIKQTLSWVPKLTSYISLYNEPLCSWHLY